MSQTKATPLHIAMYPWLAMGHITSFLRIGNKLAERGHKISFFLPPKTQLRFTTQNLYPEQITFIPVTLPPVNGLPAEAETTNDIPAVARPLLMTAMDLTKDTIEAHLVGLRPNYVFFDFTCWIPELAHKLEIKPVFYLSTLLVASAYVFHLSMITPQGQPIKKAHLMSPLPSFPSPFLKHRAHEAQSFIDDFHLDFGGGLTLLDRVGRSLRECDAFVTKGCREMEEIYYEFVEKKYGKPVLTAGPVLPEPSSEKLNYTFDKWMASFRSGHVVYCAFGSECTLDLISFQELVLGLELTVDGFPTEAETTNDIPAEARPLLMTAMDLTKPTIEAHLVDLRPNFVFFDFTCWMPELAHKHGIKPIYYMSALLVRAAYILHLSVITPMGQPIKEAHLMSPLPLFPSPLMTHRAHEARSLIEAFHLDFGECTINLVAFQELVLGLELTGRPFLAALKAPTGHDTIESAMPEGFLERTKDRGIVYGGWVQQQLILRHPSVGCFVTHCGAGSLSEAMVNKCQLVMIPHAVDQFINSRMMSLELRVGVEVERRDDDGFFSREDVRKAVESVMDENSVVGKEVRANHAKWREFILKDGVEESYISGFIDKLYDLLR